MKMMIEVLQQMKPDFHNLVGLCAIAVERKDTRVNNALKRIPGHRINGQSERQSNIWKQEPTEMLATVMMMRVLHQIKQL